MPNCLKRGRETEEGGLREEGHVTQQSAFTLKCNKRVCGVQSNGRRDVRACVYVCVCVCASAMRGTFFCAILCCCPNGAFDAATSFQLELNLELCRPARRMSNVQNKCKTSCKF